MPEPKCCLRQHLFRYIRRTLHFFFLTFVQKMRKRFNNYRKRRYGVSTLPRRLAFPVEAQKIYGKELPHVRPARIGEVTLFVQQTISELARQGVLAPPGTYSPPPGLSAPGTVQTQPTNILPSGQVGEVPSPISGCIDGGCEGPPPQETVEEGLPGLRESRPEPRRIVIPLRELLDFLQKKNVDFEETREKD